MKKKKLYFKTCRCCKKLYNSKLKDDWFCYSCDVVMTINAKHTQEAIDQKIINELSILKGGRHHG